MCEAALVIFCSAVAFHVENCEISLVLLAATSFLIMVTFKAGNSASVAKSGEFELYEFYTKRTTSAVVMMSGL